MTPADVSIIMPVLDEAEHIGPALRRLQALRVQGVELVVADGGSRDGTAREAAALADRVLQAPRGRAAQMNAGAAASRGRILLFLHADTALPDRALDALTGAVAGGAPWGRFDVRLDSERPLLRVVAALMNLRSRLSGIATGDQAIFVRRDAFEQAGRYPDIPLMEDISLSAALKRLGRPACLRDTATSSARRWESRGVLRTILLMWRLRAAFFFGADPAQLARRYGYRPRDS